MGLQNATISLMSSGEIRTTNIFALLTVLGAELGKRNVPDVEHSSRWAETPPTSDRLAIVRLLVAYFILGFAIGWLGFEYFGLAFALTLAALSMPPPRIIWWLRCVERRAVEAKLQSCSRFAIANENASSTYQYR